MSIYHNMSVSQSCLCVYYTSNFLNFLFTYSLFDWCFCAWLPPSLYLRDPRASLGDCEDRSRSRPLRRKWLGVPPPPLSGGLSPCGTTPLHMTQLHPSHMTKLHPSHMTSRWTFIYCLPLHVCICFSLRICKPLIISERKLTYIANV